MVGAISQQMSIHTKGGLMSGEGPGKERTHSRGGSCPQRIRCRGRHKQKSMPGKVHIRGGTTARGRSVTWKVPGREGSLAWEVHRREGTAAGGGSWPGKSRLLSGFWSYGPSLGFVKIDI